jgi:2-methylcitrate dehydratase PrpD
MENAEGSVALANWAATVGRDTTLAATPQIIAAIRDVLGCALAGQAEPEPQQVARAVARWGSGVSRVIGTALSLPAPFAALVNGASAHILDFDDSFAPLTGHACTTIVPAVLAVAEQVDASGEDLIDAVSVALEITARIGAAVNPQHYGAGWHATATIGAIASAAGVGRVLGLSAERMRHALSLAVSQAAGTRMQLGTSAKCLHAGLSANAGVLAAMLAAEGLSGAEEAIMGRWRFAEMYAAGATPTITAPMAGETLAIIDPGITYKPYPTCGATHRSLAALLDLRTQHGFHPADIEHVEIVIPAMNVENLIYPDPSTGMEARFSMQYCAALAIAQGRLAPSDFSHHALARPEIRALMPLIEMRPLPGSEDAAKNFLDYPVHTTVKLRGGSTLTDTRYHRPGSSTSPLTLDQQLAKFRSCAEVSLSKARTENAIDLIDRLPFLAKVSALTQAISPQ